MTEKNKITIISPPGSDSFQNEIMFSADVLFFISTRDLRASSADRREILLDDQNCVEFYNADSKFWGLSAQKLGAKNTQNLARFGTTAKFGGEH